MTQFVIRGWTGRCNLCWLLSVSIVTFITFFRGFVVNFGPHYLFDLQIFKQHGAGRASLPPLCFILFSDLYFSFFDALLDAGMSQSWVKLQRTWFTHFSALPVCSFAKCSTEIITHRFVSLCAMIFDWSCILCDCGHVEIYVKLFNFVYYLWIF